MLKAERRSGGDRKAKCALHHCRKTDTNIARVLALTGLMALFAVGCGRETADRDVLFQTSTIFALMAGAYDGDLTCGELKTHGDIGLGTFNALDGEMVMLDGVIYQVKADGLAYCASDAIKTPFAAVTFFEADETATLQKAMGLKQLTDHIDSLLPTTNVPYAVKIQGRFHHVKTRSVPRQTPPYPRLVEVVKNQPTFDLESVRGTIVGFRLPEYVKGINVPAYHLHFITADGARGGHVLELTTGDVKIEIDACSSIQVALPRTAGFEKADLSRQSKEELEKVEK